MLYINTIYVLYLPDLGLHFLPVHIVGIKARVFATGVKRGFFHLFCPCSVASSRELLNEKSKSDIHSGCMDGA